MNEATAASAAQSQEDTVHGLRPTPHDSPLHPAPPEVRRRIPYVTQWEAEDSHRLPPLAVRGGRVGKDFLGYRRERPGDRDAHGTLWRRTPSRPGLGRPQLGKVHPARQRRAIGGLLCSVCGKPTGPEAAGRGYLYVMSGQDYACAPGAPIETMEPPVHRACGWASVNACPHLRGQYVALRAPAPRTWGVFGQVVCPGPDGTLRNLGLLTLPRADWRMRWVVAQALVSVLDTHTLVDLEADAGRVAAAAS